VTSPAFADGGTIPDRHSSAGRGDNISPALRWSAPPHGTRQLLLVIEDVDTPSRRPGVHTIALLAPGTEGLEEGALTASDHCFGYVPNHRGRTGYVGPRPLPGHGTHRYRFHLYALASEVRPGDVNSLDDLLPRVAGHALAAGMLEGTQRG
jgi:phosphatidylethanolamine-binding protein (PEBP) family uncharacterized protein